MYKYFFLYVNQFVELNISRKQSACEYVRNAYVETNM